MVNRGIPEGAKKIELGDLPIFLAPGGNYFRKLYDLYVYVRDNIEPNPVVIDIDDLLADPGRVLKAYCEAVNIPYTDDLLHWKPGRECFDELWMVAKEHILDHNVADIHKETFASTGFGQVLKCPSRSELSEDVLHYSDLSMKYYEEMYANRLKCWPEVIVMGCEDNTRHLDSIPTRMIKWHANTVITYNIRIWAE